MIEVENAPNENARILSMHSQPLLNALSKETNTNPIGRHLLIDYWQCNADLLNNEIELVQYLVKAAEIAGAQVISTHSHAFQDQGVTAIAILAESHISIHTWPETHYAGVDIYTCGNANPLLAHQFLLKALSSKHSEFTEMSRGNAAMPNSMTASATLRSGLESDNSWFIEGSVPGKRFNNVSHGFLISELICQKTTPFQECLIFDTPVYGRVMTLDGIVQFSTSDEHIYHEMIVHTALFSHPNPKRIVIVGGGDGGTLREVLKHNPEEVVMIDIDCQIIEAAAEHLPSLSDGAFNDPRLTLIFDDASEALKNYRNAFDVAIIDCNDAVGTSKRLFTDDFYATVSSSLKDKGLSIIQAGSLLDEDFLKQTRARMEKYLGQTTGFKLTMPSYHCGEYVFMMATSAGARSGPEKKVLDALQAQRNIETKYWSPAIHHSSQVLPPRSTLW